MSWWNRITSVGASLASRSAAAAVVVRDLTVRATRGLINQAITGLNTLAGRQVERPIEPLRVEPSRAEVSRNLRRLRRPTSRSRFRHQIARTDYTRIPDFRLQAEESYGPIRARQLEAFEAKEEEFKEPSVIFDEEKDIELPARNRQLRDLRGDYEVKEQEEKAGAEASDYRYVYTRDDINTQQDYHNHYNNLVAQEYAALTRDPARYYDFYARNPTPEQRDRAYVDQNLLFRFRDIAYDFNNGIPIPLNLLQSIMYQEVKAPDGSTTWYDPFGVLDYRVVIRGYQIKPDGSRERFETIRNVTMRTFEGIEFEMNRGAETIYATWSDSWGDLGTVDIDEIEFVHDSLLRGHKRNKVGLFFGKVNASDIELSMYQIFQRSQIKENCVARHCLLQALEHQGVTKAELNKLTDMMQNDIAFEITKMSKVADKLQRTIWTYQVRDGVPLKRNVVKPEYKNNGKILKLALHNTHYFAYEVTCYTREFFQKYLAFKQGLLPTTFEELLQDCDKQNGVSYFPHRYINGTDHIDGFHNKHFLMSSLDIVLALEANGFFKETLDRHDEAVALNMNRAPDLAFYEQEEEIYQYEAPKQSSIQYVKFFADTETETTDTHQTLIGGIKEMGKDNYKCFNFRRRYRDGNCLRQAEDGVAYNILQFIYKRMNEIKEQNKGLKDWEGKDVKFKPIIYFHNVKYDLHVMFRDFKGVIKPLSLLETNGIVYQFTCMFYNLKIEFRDSYKILSQALSTFGDSFKLPKHMCKKEFMGYSWYKRSNYDTTTVKVDEYFQHISKNRLDFTNLTYVRSTPEEITRRGFLQALQENAKEFDYNSQAQTFNPWKYYEYYMMYDVLVMEAGLKAFDEQIHKLYGISCFDSLTVSSLAHKIATSNGAYNGVAQVSGEFRKALSEMIKGGMCHANKDLLGILIEAEQLAIDCNSEYPASMVRLCEEYGGLPTGLLKRYQSEEEFYCRSVWKTNKQGWYNWYVPRNDGKQTQQTKVWERGVHFFAVKILITKVNKKQNIPFIAHLRDGILDYLNEPPFEYVYDEETGKIKRDEQGHLVKKLVPIWVSMIKLEDLINFQHIEYEFLEGFYTDEGVNGEIGKIVCNLYAAKLQAEADGNDAAVVTIKLLLNSIYGKTIMKARNFATVIMENDAYDFEDQWDGYKTKKVKTNVRKGERSQTYFDNYMHIITAKKHLNEDYTIFKKYAYDANASMPHIGALILDMSKRILYQVLDSCNELQAQVSYIDTDSIRLKKADLAEVEKFYKARYNRELIGNELGQFKYDIKLKYPVEDEKGEISVKKAKDVVVTTELNAGKKMYLDIIKGVDHTGKEIWSHYKRCKGVTAGALDYFCKLVYWELNSESRPLFERSLEKGLRIIKQEGNVVVLLRGYYERMLDNDIFWDYNEELEETFKTLNLKYEIEEKTRKSKDADGNEVVKILSKKVSAKPRDLNIYFNFKLIQPSPELLSEVTQGKLHITPGFDGDILALYQDICTDKGVEIQNVVPEGKPFFEFDYCVQVKTKKTFKRTVRMAKERKIKDKIFRPCGIKGVNILGEEYYMEGEIEVSSDLELDEASADQVGF